MGITTKSLLESIKQENIIDNKSQEEYNVIELRDNFEWVFAKRESHYLNENRRQSKNTRTW